MAITFFDKCYTYVDKESLTVNTRLWFSFVIIPSGVRDGVYIGENLYRIYTMEYVKNYMRPISSYAVFEKYLFSVLKSYERVFHLSKSMHETNNPKDIAIFWPTKRSAEDRFRNKFQLMTHLMSPSYVNDYFYIVTTIRIQQSKISLPLIKK